MDKKKKIILISSIIAAVLIIVGIIVTVIILNNKPKEKGFRTIQIQEIDGSVLINRNNKENEAYKGMNLKNGDNIKTKDDSHTILKLDLDKYIYIGNNSSIDLTSSEKDSTKTIIRVNEGSIVTEVKNKLSDLEEFDVEAPNSTMAIRGTTFGVSVYNEDGKLKTTYSLVEGKIEIFAIKNVDGNIEASKFVLNPMEELSMYASIDDSLTGTNLTNAINDIKESNTTVINDLKDYDSKNILEIVFRELELEDIEDILRKIPTNHDEGFNRVISINSTFDVIENKSIKVRSLFKYESNKEYSIKATAKNKDGYSVKKWLVNNKEVNGEILELDIKESCLIEPIYEEDAINVEVNSSTYDNMVKVNDSYINSAKTLNDVKDKITMEYTGDDKYLFIGWYDITNNKQNLISTDKTYSFTPTKSIKIKAIYIDKSNRYFEFDALDESSKVMTKKFYDIGSSNDLPKISFYLSDNNTGNTVILDDILISKLLSYKLQYTYTENVYDVDSIDTSSIGRYSLVYSFNENQQVYKNLTLEVGRYNLSIYQSMDNIAEIYGEYSDFTGTFNDIIVNSSPTITDSMILTYNYTDNNAATHTFLGWYNKDTGDFLSIENGYEIILNNHIYIEPRFAIYDSNDNFGLYKIESNTKTLITDAASVPEIITTIGNELEFVFATSTFEIPFEAADIEIRVGTQNGAVVDSIDFDNEGRYYISYSFQNDKYTLNSGFNVVVGKKIATMNMSNDFYLNSNISSIDIIESNNNLIFKSIYETEGDNRLVFSYNSDNDSYQIDEYSNNGNYPGFTFDIDISDYNVYKSGEETLVMVDNKNITLDFGQKIRLVSKSDPSKMYDIYYYFQV